MPAGGGRRDSPLRRTMVQCLAPAQYPRPGELSKRYAAHERPSSGLIPKGGERFFPAGDRIGTFLADREMRPPAILKPENQVPKPQSDAEGTSQFATEAAQCLCLSPFVAAAVGELVQRSAWESDFARAIRLLVSRRPLRTGPRPEGGQASGTALSSTPSSHTPRNATRDRSWRRCPRTEHRRGWPWASTDPDSGEPHY
jgi:hypothetical protein